MQNPWPLGSERRFLHPGALAVVVLSLLAPAPNSGWAVRAFGDGVRAELDPAVSVTVEPGAWNGLGVLVIPVPVFVVGEGVLVWVVGDLVHAAKEPGEHDRWAGSDLFRA